MNIRGKFPVSLQSAPYGGSIETLFKIVTSWKKIVK